MFLFLFFFFFSSRRRHTRFSRDWSSDVCSSDLREWLREDPAGAGRGIAEEAAGMYHELHGPRAPWQIPGPAPVATVHAPAWGPTNWTGHGGPQGFQV